MQIGKPKISTDLSPEVKAFGVPFISIVVIVLVIIFAVMPLWTKVNEKQTQLKNAKQELTALENKEKELRSLDANRLENQFQIAETALPSGKEVPALLVGISRLYQEQGLELTSLKIIPGKVSTESAAPKAGSTAAESATPVVANVNANRQIFPSNKRLDFDLVLSGTLEQARGFLKTLEKSLRLLTVNSLSFTRGANGVPQLTLKVSAPFEPFPPVPTNFAEGLPSLTKEDLDILGKLSTYTPLTTPFSDNTTAGGNSNPFSGTTTQAVKPTPTSRPTALPTPQTATGSSSLP